MFERLFGQQNRNGLEEAMEGRETIEGVAKVVQVRDDNEFERHSGGIGAINWIWGIMQR